MLICTGQESRLVDCSHAGIGNTDFCLGGHASDAGVICGEGIKIYECIIIAFLTFAEHKWYIVIYSIID